MPEYEDPILEEAQKLGKEASHAFDLGVDYRATGEHYVRVTVILAAVLFLIAIGQRFKVAGCATRSIPWPGPSSSTPSSSSRATRTCTAAEATR